jgi:hypothetical protein
MFLSNNIKFLLDYVVSHPIFVVTVVRTSGLRCIISYPQPFICNSCGQCGPLLICYIQLAAGYCGSDRWVQPAYMLTTWLLWYQWTEVRPGYQLHYIVMHAVRYSALIMVFNLIQTSLHLERGGRSERAASLIHVHCDVEVCADTCDHCCPHLHLGYSTQPSRACKKSIWKLTFTDTVLCKSCLTLCK